MQVWGCSRARDIFETPGTTSKKTTCSFSYRFRGSSGISALYQGLRVARLCRTVGSSALSGMFVFYSPGPGDTPWDTPSHFRGHPVGHSPGHFGPEGPERLFWLVGAFPTLERKIVAQFLFWGRGEGVNSQISNSPTPQNSWGNVNPMLPLVRSSQHLFGTRCSAIWKQHIRIR